MSNGRGKHKSRGKKRAKVVSRGTAVGASKAPQGAIQKALLGKGQMQSMRPVEGRDYRDTWGKAYSRIQFFILSEDEAA